MATVLKSAWDQTKKTKRNKNVGEDFHLNVFKIIESTHFSRANDKCAERTVGILTLLMIYIHMINCKTLGCILFLMLTGFPFCNDSVVIIICFLVPSSFERRRAVCK